MMDDNEMTAETIRLHMQAIRRDLRTNVNEVVSGANQLLDWKSYVRGNPWLMIGGAAALGYMIVPGRSRELEAVTAAQASLNGLAEEFRAQTRPASTSRNLFGLALPIVGGLLSRAAAVYGAALVDQLLAPIAQSHSPEDLQRPEGGRKQGQVVAGSTAHQKEGAAQ